MVVRFLAVLFLIFTSSLSLGKGSFPDSIKINKDVLCMAEVIYDEARGESEKGKVAIAATVMNRVKHSKYPNTVCEVIYQKFKGVCQFSGMCKKKKKIFDAESLKIAYNVVMYEKYKDPTLGATHFHNNFVKPNWSSVYVRTTRIGNHVFYRRP